ncbi:MAG: precorrin-3B C(17)-methyltransferase [Thermodesulfobacteriota bacterium]
MRSSGHESGEREEMSDHQDQVRQGDPGGGPPRLSLVGIGPGSAEHLSGRAWEVLAEARVVAGYTPYLDLIRPFLAGKALIASGMTREMERVSAAVRAAREQGPCALVCSGDPGIYALAGLVFEVCRAQGIPVSPAGAPPGGPGELTVEVVPGIPSLCAGAALLGAPLVHDFASVSLSDRLTPWETIEKRLDAAALADFVIVIHNPKSKTRTWQLARACEIIARHRPGTTPAGVVRRAMRKNQSVTLCTLEGLPEADVDMETILFVGNSKTFRHGSFLVTPRGYLEKYGATDAP